MPNLYGSAVERRYANDHTFRNAVHHVCLIFRELSEEERDFLLTKIAAEFCLHCGSKDAGRCQCQNDD